MSDFVKQNAIDIIFKKNQPWVILTKIEQQIKEKIEKYGTPLGEWPDIKINRGILTGCNEAFIIDEKKRQEILSNCKTKDEYQKTDNLIRPILRGRDIKQGSYEWAGLYVITAYFGIFKDLMNISPAIYEHLSKYKSKLENRGQCKYLSSGQIRKPSDNNYPGYPGMHHWLELDNCPSKNYLDDLNNQKIIYSEIVKKPQFFYDKEGVFLPEASAFYLTGLNLDYLVDYFNSDFSSWVFKKYYAGGGLGNNGYRYKKAFFIYLPVSRNMNIDYYSAFHLNDEEIEYIKNAI